MDASQKALTGQHEQEQAGPRIRSAEELGRKKGKEKWNGAIIWLLYQFARLSHRLCPAEAKEARLGGRYTVLGKNLCQQHLVYPQPTKEGPPLT